MEFTIKVEGKGLQDIVEAIIDQTMQRVKGEYAQKACAYESTREGLMTEYNKLKSQMVCLKAGMEVMKAPVVITFIPQSYYRRVSHPIKYKIFFCDADGYRLNALIPPFRQVSGTAYQYCKTDFINGNLYEVENKLFICRVGKENIYLIQFPRGLN